MTQPAAKNNMNDALKNPVVLLLLGMLTGGTGMRLSVDDGDRFRGRDAEKMEARLMAEIERRVHPHDLHLDVSEQWKDKIRDCEHDCARCWRAIEDMRSGGE